MINKWFKLGNKSLAFMVQDTPRRKVFGIHNELPDVEGVDNFVTFLDYDDVMYEVVCRDLMHLNKIFGLCSFVILVNNEQEMNNMDGEKVLIGNYNVIGLDKIKYTDHVIILNHTRCDSAFKYVGKKWIRRNWVLRLSGKFEQDGKTFKPEPKVKDIIKFPGKCTYQHSNAMKKQLERWFDMKIKLNSLDRGKKLEYIRYDTPR